MRRDLFEGQEVPAQRWVDLSEVDGQGVALVNSSKYGFSLEGDTLTMTLLRASIDPDPLPDIGDHIVEYALVPHGAGWAISDSVQLGEEMNIPLVVTSCGFQAGDLPSAQSLVAIETPNVRLAAMKKCQDGKALLLRLVEADGQATTARIVLGKGLVADSARAVEVDTLERPLQTNSAALDGNKLTVAVPAFGISAVRIG
jgi:alpha-mannosidase